MLHRLDSLRRVFRGIREISSHRLYSSPSSRFQPIRILWASQGGTAKLFGNELRQVLEDASLPGVLSGEDIVVHGWHEFPPEQLLSEDSINILLTSVTRVGEPPDNGRAFFEYLTKQSNIRERNNALISDRVRYSVFGLGNSKAHPNHFNTIGKVVDERLASLGATRMHPLGLGDDGDCIEDDFDAWTESILRTLKNNDPGDDKVDDEVKPMIPNLDAQIAEVQHVEGSIQNDSESVCRRVPCTSTKHVDGQRRVSTKYPQVQLRPASSSVVHHDLFHLRDENQQFYADSTIKARVVKSNALSTYGGEAGLREIVLDIQDQLYETGDHCVVYPRNDDLVVEAYLQHLLKINVLWNRTRDTYAY